MIGWWQRSHTEEIKVGQQNMRLSKDVIHKTHEYNEDIILTVATELNTILIALTQPNF